MACVECLAARMEHRGINFVIDEKSRAEIRILGCEKHAKMAIELIKKATVLEPQRITEVKSEGKEDTDAKSTTEKTGKGNTA